MNFFGRFDHINVDYSNNDHIMWSLWAIQYTSLCHAYKSFHYMMHFFLFLAICFIKLLLSFRMLIETSFYLIIKIKFHSFHLVEKIRLQIHQMMMMLILSTQMDMMMMMISKMKWLPCIHIITIIIFIIIIALWFFLRIYATCSM